MPNLFILFYQGMATPGAITVILNFFIVRIKLVIEVYVFLETKGLET